MDSGDMLQDLASTGCSEAAGRHPRTLSCMECESGSPFRRPQFPTENSSKSSQLQDKAGCWRSGRLGHQGVLRRQARL